MTKKSTPPTIGSWLKNTSTTFALSTIQSSSLDAELLLCYVLGKSRTYLHAHPDIQLSDNQVRVLSQLAARRLTFEPIAYLVQNKEFYGRNFYVNSSVLIPRPESEIIIELLKKYTTSTHHTLADIGTGSGCLAITAKKELPHVHVDAYDISVKALIVAKQNAHAHNTHVTFKQSNLLEDVRQEYDIIIANLPYVDPSWQRDSKETDHEPSLALFASNEGISLIEQLIHQSKTNLTVNGLLILEADPCQHKNIIAIALKSHLSLVEVSGYVLVFAKR